MLEIIGTVKAILNADLLLVETTKPLRKDQTLLVFRRIPKENLGAEIDVEALDIPIGHIQVTLEQGSTLYLAERFERTKTRRRIERQAGNVLYDFLNPLRDRVVEEEQSAGWSAKFDEDQALGVSEARVVQVGDLVGWG